MTQAFAVGAIVLLAFAGLGLSNVLCDRGAPKELARRVAPVTGGVAFLAAVLWLEVSTAVVVSAILMCAVVAVHFRFRRALRGVEGSLSSQDRADITYAVAGTLSLAIGWWLLDDRWLAFVPVAFMAWGDSAAGLVREWLRHGSGTTVWPSIAMLGVCLCAAVLVQPYWIAVVGASVGTALEFRRPIVAWASDDNLYIVGGSLAVIGSLAGMTT